MSKLKRLLGALSLVSLFIFSSCVDDSIAPEVTALRQAQVDLLNAEVAFQTAETALLNARVELQGIINSHTAALNAIEQQSEQSDLDVQLSEDAVDLQDAANDLEESLADLEEQRLENMESLLDAQQSLAEAQEDFEAFLATQGLELAAEYVNAWNALYNGGTVDLPGTDFAALGGGIFAIQQDIADKEVEIALLKLLNNADDRTVIPQDVLLARKQQDIDDAQMAFDGAGALLASAEAALAGSSDPKAPLREQLLALAADSVEADAALEAVEDELTALGDLSAESDSIVSAFENIASPAGGTSTNPAYTGIMVGGVDADNYVLKGNLYVAELVKKDDAEDSLAGAQDHAATLGVYADSLQAAYDRHFPLVTEYEDEIAALETELADAEADSASGGDVTAADIANDEAFSDYIIAENIFRNKGADNTSADTIAFVQARNSWDGASRSDIFVINTTTEDVLTDSVATSATPGGDGLYPVKAGWTPVSYGAVGGMQPFNDMPQGGTWATLQAELASNTAAGLPAIIRFELQATEAQYGTVVDEFRQLAAYIAAVDGLSGTAIVDDNNSYADEVSAGFPTPTDFLSEAQGNFQAYVDDIDSYTEILEDIEDGKTPKNVKDAIDAQTEKVGDADDELDDLAPFVADYLAAYDSALAELDDIAEAVDLATIPLQLARYNAIIALNSIVSAMDDLRDDIDDANSDVLALNDDDGVVEEPAFFAEYAGTDYTVDPADLQALIDEIEDDLEDLEDDIYDAQEALAEAEVNAPALATEIAIEEEKLANLQTELSVMEGFVAEIEALLAAALAG